MAMCTGAAQSAAPPLFVWGEKMSEKQQPKTTAARKGRGTARKSGAAPLSETEQAVAELLNALQELSGDTTMEKEKKAALPEAPAAAGEKTDKAKTPARKRAPAKTKESAAKAKPAAGKTAAKTKAEAAEKAPARRKAPAKKKTPAQETVPPLPEAMEESSAMENTATGAETAVTQVPPVKPEPPAEKAETPVERAAEPEKTEPAEMSGLPEEKTEPPAETAEAAQVPEEKAEPAASPVCENDEKAEPGEEEPSEEERQRVIDMTRTVQVSIEQIMARAAEQAAAAPPDPEPEHGHEEPAHGETLADRLAGGAVRLARWAALVLFLVLVIAGAGLAWLYRGATPDALPQITVTMSGHTLEAAAYRWKVPVVGNVLQRTFAETLRAEPTVVEEPLITTHPILVVQPTGLEASLTVRDAEGTEVFTGTPEELRDQGLPGNGAYQAKLTVTKPADRFADGNSVSGSQSYLFDFSVGIQPSLRLSASSAAQGSVVTVQVTNVQEESVPALNSEFQTTGFRKGQNGWVAYLPIPCDAAPGSYTLRVSVGSFTGELTLTVRAASWQSSEVYSASSLVTPYLGLADTPAEVRDVLDVQDDAAAWAEKGFVQPFLNTITVTLPYGAVESVRSTGASRTATNAVVKTRWGSSLISPADGRVLLAEDLGGAAGNTVVIEHGAGVKSIFYRLASLDVARGGTVRQGQSIGTANGAIIAEVRVGRVPVEPFTVWRNQCNALKIN